MNKLLWFSQASAVVLQAGSPTAESALAQIDANAFQPCMCFMYIEGGNLEIKNGGYLRLPDSAECVVRDGYKEITNEGCVFQMWMCSCWAN